MGALMITFILNDLLSASEIIWLSHWNISKMVGLQILTFLNIIYSKPTKDKKEKKYFVVSFFRSLRSLGASPWKVVDQIEKVERHEEEGEHEK